MNPAAKREKFEEANEHTEDVKSERGAHLSTDCLSFPPHYTWGHHTVPELGDCFR